jgi:hypothetical protein
MNDAKKISEMQKIYYFESKENETNKSKLSELTEKYEDLENLCKDLVDMNDSKKDIQVIIQKIKHHLIYK